jgi:UPF0042 nucleotide-binding protein
MFSVELKRPATPQARFVVVAGLSGAGKSQAMKSFEDLGFYCADNLPPALVADLVTLVRGAGIERVALSLDVRVGGPFGDPLVALEHLRSRGIAFEVLFLEANDDVLVRRYSETRRRHPHECGASLGSAIEAERERLAPLRATATRVWDTSQLTQASLKARVATFASDARAHGLALNVVAFGFKFGLPLDADLVFDVRFFPNPNYVAELKPLTGNDPPVAAFMAALPEMEAFLERLYALVDFVLPLSAAEGKSRLTIGIGCTGGRHRSVYVASRLAEHLRTAGLVPVALENRELVPA